MEENKSEIKVSLAEELPGGKELVDINTASLRKLITLPGVGRALARRIIDQRPFKSFDEFRQKCGIKDALWEKLEPYCRISLNDIKGQALEEEKIISQSEHASPAAKDEASEKYTDQLVSIVPLAEIPPKNEKSAEKSEKKHAPPATSMWWISIVVGVIVLCLSIASNLSILAVVNNGLRYASATEYVDIRREVGSVEDQLQGIRSDLWALQERLDNLQGLSGRMENIESVHKELRGQLLESVAEVKQVQSKIEDLSKQIGVLSDQVEKAQNQANRFERFFQGLKELLEAVQP